MLWLMVWGDVQRGRSGIRQSVGGSSLQLGASPYHVLGSRRQEGWKLGWYKPQGLPLNNTFIRWTPLFQGSTHSKTPAAGQVFKLMDLWGMWGCSHLNHSKSFHGIREIILFPLQLQPALGFFHLIFLPV